MGATDVGAGDAGEVHAAGGIPWRRAADGTVEVLVIHRPRYDDWTFPKGKLDPGEGWEQAAVREVWEETGLVTVLGPELPSTSYEDRHGRPKRVRYWAMAVAADAGFEAGEEVDERRWLPVADVAQVLTHERDVQVLGALDAAGDVGGSSAS